MQYILGDLHLNHNKMKEIRGYSSLDEMNLDIITKCNKEVHNKKDTLIITGDLSFAPKEKTKELLNKLNGYKILIKGNHDKHSKKWYHEVGINSVIEDSLYLVEEKVIISHRPVKELPIGVKNIHAHLHDLLEPEYMNASYFNTSWEAIRKPLLLKEILKVLNN